MAVSDGSLDPAAEALTLAAGGVEVVLRGGQLDAKLFEGFAGEG